MSLVETVQGRYTLLTHIPVYVGEDGTVQTEALWAKDLGLHVDYLPDLHLCCPVFPHSEIPHTLEAAPVPGMESSRFHHIARNQGWGSVLRNILPHFWAMGRVSKESDIVQAAGGGWPFPLAFYLLFWRLIHRFQWVMIMESSFWRLEPGERGSLRQRVAHHTHMALIPLCLKWADARIFTQDEYRETLLGHHENTLINPAVWYDVEQMETEAGLAERQASRSGLPRILFPSRLVPSKGVSTVMAAVSELKKQLPEGGPVLQLDIIGQGELAEACRAFAAEDHGTIEVRFLDPVPYGRPFLELLRGYDAIVVANQKAEQPRILFDGFSQGVPAIVSRTPGTLDVVEDGVTAEMFEPGDAVGLADGMQRLIDDPARFQSLGKACLTRAATFTHAAMHETRHRFLKKVLDC